MPVFTKVGDTNPFLHVSMAPGERIFAESDAMVMMDAELELTGKMQGGLVSSLARRLANDESLFLQELSAPRGPGDALFAPATPGDIEILDVGQVQYMLNDGAFVACTERIDIKVQMQNPINALFGGTGGFIISRTTGVGQVVVSGLGAIFSIDVVPGKDIVVDNYHVVAWDARLSYSASLSTNRRGFISSLVNSQTTGEGIVTRFSGAGKVYICSRNPAAMAAFVAAMAQKGGISQGQSNNASAAPGGLNLGTIANLLNR